MKIYLRPITLKDGNFIVKWRNDEKVKSHCMTKGTVTEESNEAFFKANVETGKYKQFMVGNGILAFAVIFVVVIFIYMSMRLQRDKQEQRHFIETYSISLVKGFAGDSVSLYVNDSLILNKTISEEPYTVEVGRFAEQSALLVVDNKTELVSTFDLSERGGTYQFEKEADGIKQLAR